jgi:hypothetical protein
MKRKAIRLPALLYHHVGIPTEHTQRLGLTIRPEVFERHLRFLRILGYRGITCDQWIRWCETGSPIPRKPIVITLDDAYADTEKYALPLIEKYGFRATVFAITGHSKNSLLWEGLPLMTMAQLASWAKQEPHKKPHFDGPYGSRKCGVSKVQSLRLHISARDQASGSSAGVQPQIRLTVTSSPCGPFRS